MKSRMTPESPRTAARVAALSTKSPAASRRSAVTSVSPGRSSISGVSGIRPKCHVKSVPNSELLSPQRPRHQAQTHPLAAPRPTARSSAATALKRTSSTAGSPLAPHRVAVASCAARSANTTTTGPISRSKDALPPRRCASCGAYSGHRERLDRFIVNAPIGAS